MSYNNEHVIIRLQKKKIIDIGVLQISTFKCKYIIINNNALKIILRNYQFSTAMFFLMTLFFVKE